MRAMGEKSGTFSYRRKSVIWSGVAVSLYRAMHSKTGVLTLENGVFLRAFFECRYDRNRVV